jgi:UDP-2,3-diacylglucosamine pyrophosphatase LpxH
MSQGGAKIKVDTLIISDVHLGFKYSRVTKLTEVLARYRFKRLILNGDIFDDLNFNRLNSEHWDVLSLFRHLSKYAEVVWVIGNHDGRADVLSRLLGVTVHDDYLWKVGRHNFLAIHGHQFDRFMYKNMVVGKLAGRLFYFLKRFEGKNEALTNWIGRHSRNWLRMSDEVAFGAIKYAKTKGASYVFCGHTHLARTLEFSGVKYFNSGCWVELPSSLITIKGDKVELKRIK